MTIDCQVSFVDDNWSFHIFGLWSDNWVKQFWCLRFLCYQCNTVDAFEILICKEAMDKVFLKLLGFVHAILGYSVYWADEVKLAKFKFLSDDELDTICLFVDI